MCVAVSQLIRKNFRCKIYSRKVFLYVFLVRKYFHNEIKVNYGIWSFWIYCSSAGIHARCSETGAPSGAERQSPCKDSCDPALGEGKDHEVSLPAREKKCYSAPGEGFTCW